MPWFAWIAVVALAVWGVVAIVAMSMGRPIPGIGAADVDGSEIEDLQERVQQLEAQLEDKSATGRRALSPELERRIERLEARSDRREIRDGQQDAWDREAKDLGLED